MTKNARRLTDTPDDEKKPGTTGHRADSETNHHTEKNSASGAKKEAVPSCPIAWPESEADRRVATRKWHAIAIRNLTGSALRAADIVDDQLLPGTSTIFRTDEFLAGEFGGSKRNIERNFADLENEGFARITALWGGNGRRARVVGRRIILCVPLSTADALNDKNVEQCDISVEPDDKNVGPNDRNVETYNIDLGKKTSERGPSKKNQNAGRPASPNPESAFSLDELTLIEKEAKSDSEIDELILEKKIESRTHFLNAARARLSKKEKLGIKKGGSRWQALYDAIELACQRATIQADLREAEREKEDERLAAARRLEPDEHFRSWRSTWNEPRFVGTTGRSYAFWYIGDDVRLSREQLERKSRRQAESDFDRFTEKWAEPFGSDRPIRPRFNELPEELQKEAIRFVEEKNLHLLDDGFDEVA